MNSSTRTSSSQIFGRCVFLASSATALVALFGCAAGLSRTHYAVYSLNQAGQFGSLDVSKGKFTRIGPVLPEGESGLVLGPSGSLLTLGFSGTLYSIEPATGVAKPIGATGLTDCIGPPEAPCGPHAADNIAILGSTIYVNDLGTNLYTTNPTTGKSTLVGSTGIPPALSSVDTVNPDGSFNFFDFNLFSANGKLYATSDSTITDFNKGTSVEVVPAALYEINVSTGKATKIASTTANLTCVFTVGSTVYAYYGFKSEFVTLSLTDGTIKKVSDDADPTLGPTFGAYAVPIP